MVVSDPTAPGCSKNDIGTLQGGEKYRYVCSQANATEDFINIATASATTKSPKETVTASAAAAVPVQPPIIINSGVCVTWTYLGYTENRIACSNGTGGLPVFLPMVVR